MLAIILVGNAGTAVYAANGRPPGSVFLVLYYVGFSTAASWWVLSDCRERGIATSIDHGWFVFYAWPIVVPYHVLKTRGGRGVLLLGGLMLWFLATYFVIAMA